jgi:hypothetical protein
MYVVYDNMDVVMYATSNEEIANRVAQRIGGRYQYVPVI